MDWNEFINDTKELANQIKESNFQPDLIIAVARGGWFPTRLLSSLLNVKDITRIGIKYVDKERTKLNAYSKPSILDSVKNLLIVEDMLESGKSIEWAKEFYESLGYNVKLASVYITEKTKNHPNYYFKKVGLDTKFPWETL